MPHKLSYALPDQQLTLADRVKRLTVRSITLGGWILLVMFGLGAVMFVFGYMGGTIAMVVGFVMATMILITWGRWQRIRRSRGANVLLSQVRLAMSVNAPLVQWMHAVARSEAGRTRVQILRFAAGLEEGEPIASSIAAAAPELPPRTRELLLAAEANGTLPMAIERALADDTAGRRRDLTRADLQGMYAWLILFMLTLVSTVLGIFVVPKMEQIMKDFHVPAPWEFGVVTNVFESLLPLLLAIIAGLVLLVQLGRWSRAIFVRANRPSTFRPVVDRVRWWLPGFHAIDRDRGLADAFEIFADGVEQARLLPDALALSIRSHLNLSLQKKLQRWHEAMMQGRNLHEAGVAAGMPALATAFLSPGTGAEAIAPALRFLSRYYHGRHERLRIAISAALAPVTSLVLGAMVALVALSLFQSMQALIVATQVQVRP